ncbi:MAG TPA: endonuclease/exonuclease/phosphatase family protein [Chloroflexota bacterium]|nr:endonuclease/exonuclease/phosphatase family protein [Chloroflexota bacterium]
MPGRDAATHAGTAPELTVATFNLWGLNEPWRYTAERGEVRGAVPGSPATTLRLPGGAWTRRRPLLAAALARVQPDVVGLQEDWQNLEAGMHRRSQSAQLAHDLGLRAVYPPIVEPGRGRKGKAILSRHPVRRLTSVPLPAPAADVAASGPGVRDALHAVLDTPCGLLHFVVVHLTARDEAAQVAQVEGLLAYLCGLEERAGRGSLVVAGDFNARPDSPPVALMTAADSDPAAPGSRGRGRLRDAWATANAGHAGHTMLFHTPRDPGERAARFDYLFVGPGPEVGRAVLLGEEPDADGFYASDHFGVAATLRWPQVQPVR